MNTGRFKKKLEQELTVVEAELKSVGVQNPRNPADWEATELQMDVMNATADPNESADKQEEYGENRHQAVDSDRQSWGSRLHTPLREQNAQ